MNQIRQIRLVARTIWIEAIRSREIYAIVIVAVALIAGTRLINFFDVGGLSKFYQEVALKTMNVATSLTVILLAARQLPREFENRTLYPLLAKPVSRLTFLLGKFFGVMCAAAFCYALFMIIFLIGQVTTGASFSGVLFAQFVYLQMWNFSVLAALAYMLSLVFNVDAAITISSLLYLGSQIFMSLMSYIYDYLDAFQQKILVGLHFFIPQLTLFDASGKVVHAFPGGAGEAGQIWPPIAAWAIIQLTLYGMAYTALFLAGTHLQFRRRAL